MKKFDIKINGTGTREELVKHLQAVTDIVKNLSEDQLNKTHAFMSVRSKPIISCHLITDNSE